MSERREDVEEVLRLKSNPFPDGMLEAPEFPRRVYTTNVVQSVTSQIVAQTTRGPQLLKCEETGELHVTIPPSVRPNKYIYIANCSIAYDLAPNDHFDFDVVPPQGTIYSIVNLRFGLNYLTNPTTGTCELNLLPGFDNEPYLIAIWNYSSIPYIECSTPANSVATMYPSTMESWTEHLHSFKFDNTVFCKWRIYNRTNGYINHSIFGLRIYYYVEEI